MVLGCTSPRALLHPAQRDALKSYVGKGIYFGVRPEDFAYNESQSEGNGETLKANVEVVEPMGSEVYLYIDVAGQTLTVRIDTDFEPAVNAPIVLDIDMEKVHFFDKDTEKTIV